MKEDTVKDSTGEAWGCSIWLWKAFYKKTKGKGKENISFSHRKHWISEL